MSRGVWLTAGLLACIAGCSSLSRPSGLGEPLRVREGTLHEGEPAIDASSALRVTSVDNANGTVHLGAAGKAITGRTSPEAYAVGLRLADLGSGYWVVPVGATDPSASGERVFAATLDLADDLPLGPRRLELFALDDAGRAGATTEVSLCIASDLPGGDALCDPTVKPPTAFIALSWDRDVDLDLIVATPGGKIVDWKHSTTASAVNGRIDASALMAADLGQLSRDSNGRCVLDGIRREELVWTGAPRPGVYQIFANLFDACGRPAVEMSATVYRGDGVSPPAAAESARGFLPASAANGGAAIGLFLLEVELP